MYAAKHRRVSGILLVVLVIWGCGDAAAQIADPCCVETVGRSGGVLSVQNERGDTIQLTILPGALTEDVEITMRPLSTPPSHAIAVHVFPGVELEPDGLSLARPAKLELIPAAPVADPCMVLLYHVHSEDFVVPLDWESPDATQVIEAAAGDGAEDEGPADPNEGEDESAEDGIVGYLNHFSTYGGGEPTLSEAETLAAIAYEMIPPYDPYGYQAFEEALGYVLQAKKAIAKLGGDDPSPNNIEEAVLARIKDFLAEPQPEPPCNADYIQATVAYFRIMETFGLPVYDNSVKRGEVQAVRQQMQSLFEEVADRCLRQFNLHINIDVIWDENLEKNYNGEVNLGWQVYGDTPNYVYGTAELPSSGGGQYDVVTTTFDGVWYVVAEGSVDLVEDEAGVVTDLVMNLALRGEVLEEVVSCNPAGCVSAIASYHYETELSMSLKDLNHTVVKIETFDGGMAITTTTLEQVEAPLAQ